MSTYDTLQVDIGNAPNDNQGDPLRQAFDKINQRFQELRIFVSNRGNWQPSTAYTADPNRDWVIVDGVGYLATSNHTSGATFAADLAAGKWVEADSVQLRADLASTAPGKGAELVGFKQAGAGAVAIDVGQKLKKTIHVTDYGIGSGSADDKGKIQTLMDDLSSYGGGEIIFDSNNDYLVSDAVMVRSNLVLRFTGKGFLKLTQSSTVGSILSCIGTSAAPVENIKIYSPRVDGSNMGYPTGKTYGENGIAGSKCKNIRVYGGHVKNCRRGALNPIGTGGKAVQFEDGVDDIHVDGLKAEDCTVAMETGGLVDIASPYEFRRATCVFYTNMIAIRCERLISFQQTISPPSTSVSVASAVVNGVMAINCGREVPSGTELNFGLIINDRASNCSAVNVRVFNDSSYGKVSAVVKQHRGTNCIYDVVFQGDCDAIVSHDIVSGAGTTGTNSDNLFEVVQVGATAYAVNGPNDASTVENLYSITTDTVSVGLIAPNLQVSGLYGSFVDNTKAKAIEGPFVAIAAYFSNTYSTVPIAFAGEVRVNGITMTLTTGAHKITSTNDLVLAANGSDRARFNSSGTLLFSIPNHADNAAATSAGLAVGQLYRTNTGQLMIRY